jgi:hypothetical protein
VLGLPKHTSSGAKQCNILVEVVEAKAIDVDTGEQMSLLAKANRGKPGKCLFVVPEVVWDKEPNPTLDADIFQNGEKFKEQRNTWHRTRREFQNGAWIYHFRFKTLVERRFSGEFFFFIERTCYLLSE